MGMAAQLSPMFLGKRIEGIWHTGVVVYGREYTYGGIGIQWCNPGGTLLGRPHKIQDMGETHITLHLFEDFLRGLQPKFGPECYDLLKNNCNSFSNEAVQFLTGRPIPDYIINLPNEALNSPFGQQLLPFLQSLSGPGMSPIDQSSLGQQPEAVQHTSVAKVEQQKSTAAKDTEPVLQNPVLLPVDLDLRLPLIVTELKGVAHGLGIDQKILQQLAAGSSLEVNPSSAVTLAIHLSQAFSCVMEPPTAAETIAKYFVLFTSSVDLMSKLSKNTNDLAQFVSKLTLCSIEAGMCDDKDRVLSLVGATLVNCLYHGPVRAAISDQYDEVVQTTVNSYLLRSDPSVMEISSALALNVSYLSELTEDHMQELVPALLQFLQTSLESDAFSDQPALWCLTALLRLLQLSPEMVEVAKVMSLDLKKIKSYPSELLQRSCIRYEKLMSN